jgi:DNA N-6-adenine-methyltransferase (Dam)
MEGLTLSEMEHHVDITSSKVLLTCGHALLTIRAGKMYEDAGFSTFREYMNNNRGRFRMSYKTAERIMAATRVIDLLPADTQKPIMLAHALPLSHLADECILDCWNDVLNRAGTANKVTQKLCKCVVESRMGRSLADEVVDSELPLGTDGHMSNNWYTPEGLILTRVRACFGGTIDVDPCSDEQAQKVVGATTFYSVKDDGLALNNSWHGNVFVNPPYGKGDTNQGMQELFLDRAISEVSKGNVNQCILLLKVSVGSQWFAKVLVKPHCWLKDRVQFGGSTPESPEHKAQFGSVLVFIGADPTAFITRFDDIGFIPGHNSWGHSKAWLA